MLSVWLTFKKNWLSWEVAMVYSPWTCCPWNFGDNTWIPERPWNFRLYGQILGNSWVHSMNRYLVFYLTRAVETETPASDIDQVQEEDTLWLIPSTVVEPESSLWNDSVLISLLEDDNAEPQVCSSESTCCCSDTFRIQIPALPIISSGPRTSILTSLSLSPHLPQILKIQQHGVFTVLSTVSGV